MMKSRKIRIAGDHGDMKAIVLEPEHEGPVPGILWIHGGGYVLGMASMVHMSCGKLLGKKYGAVVVSPEYRLAKEAPYPAALEDCYGTLEYMWDHAEELGIDRNRIIVGGESAGGGLAAAVCLYARDLGRIRIFAQIPLYPMIDSRDTDTSRDNHGKVWNTRRNHWGWKYYLGELYQAETVPAYASPAHAKSYEDLPKCFTFVSEGEPFLRETLDYVSHLRDAGVEAHAEIYPGDVHAFDMLMPWKKTSREAKQKLCEAYEDWMKE